MQIHRVRGNNLKEALERAREVHGEHAVVLSHEGLADGGFTVSVTVDGSERAGARTAPVIEPDPSGISEPGLRDVTERLRAAGATPELADDVVEFVRGQESQGAFAIDTAATSLAGCFKAAQSPTTTDQPRVIVFVGPTGAGKSTALAKLAFRLKRAGRKVAIASLDTARPGAAEFLRSFAEDTGINFTPIRYREDLATVLSMASDCDAILLDTTGRSPGDHEHLGQLKTILNENLSDAVVSTYLVVSASTGSEVLEEVHRGFARIQPEALVITKFDETRRTAVPLEFSREVDLPVAFLCNGQDIGRDLYLATGDRMADLILGGRVR